jgi:hypothetical protein
MRMGCLSRLGCLLVVAVIAIVAWITNPLWLPRFAHRTPAATADGLVWEPITPQGAERTRQMLAKLNQPSGPVFGNLSAGDVASYVFQALSRQLPPSADSVQAAVIGDRLYIRASVKLKDLGGAAVLGPLAGMLGDREQMQFGGTFHVIRPQLAEYQVKDIKVRDFSIPEGMIPRVLTQTERGSRPEGLSPDGLPLVVPKYLGDVRIANGRVTLYKTVGQ